MPEQSAAPVTIYPELRRNPDFQLLMGGQAVSFVGTQVQDIALPLLVLALTASSIQAGAVLALNTASFLVFGLVAGALVDRVDRKRMMIWTDIARSCWRPVSRWRCGWTASRWSSCT